MEAALKRAKEAGLDAPEKWLVADGFSLVKDVKDLLEQARNKGKGQAKSQDNPAIMDKVRKQAHRWIDHIAKRRVQREEEAEKSRKMAEKEEARRKDEEE